jgi:hypothetical protein
VRQCIAIDYDNGVGRDIIGRVCSDVGLRISICFRLVERG